MDGSGVAADVTGELVCIARLDQIAQYEPVFGRTAVADPREAAHQGAEIQHGDALAELFIEFTQRAEFLGEHGETWAVQVLP